MLAILGITLPIFLLIGLGYLLARGGALTPDHARGLGRFVLILALPALVFRALAERRLDEVLQPTFLAVYGIASLAAFAAGFAWFRLGQRKPVRASAVRGIGMSFSNSGFIGLPVVLQLFGAAGAVPVALAMLIENLVMFPLLVVLAQIGDPEEQGPNARSILLNLIRTPLVIAIVAGALFSLLAIPLPGVIGRAIGLLAAASAPVALIAVGAGLVGVSLKGRVPTLTMIAGGKLLLHPLLVVLLLVLIPIQDPMLRHAVVILAAMPMLSVFPILAREYGDGETGGAALLLTTALSFVTINLLLWMLGVAPA